WPDGYRHFVYGADDDRAQTHQSGWAMRNTNNHDSSRLKKSCLGVMLCSNNNNNNNYNNNTLVNIRPFICDKARSKQKGTPCPTRGCRGILVQRKCSGHAGKPVTHVWRCVGGFVYFQCKGFHDHPRPQPKSS
ncbi:hypothetical protein HELRODRAFT_125367, partial [Helobdella robusta]|uniref:GCM domain-containing protein n=1 Tax=Helobdella robusta TaxID=6412 RepID=T1EH56_HELRO